MTQLLNLGPAHVAMAQEQSQLLGIVVSICDRLHPLLCPGNYEAFGNDNECGPWPRIDVACRSHPQEHTRREWETDPGKDINSQGPLGPSSQAGGDWRTVDPYATVQCGSCCMQSTRLTT